MAGVVIALVAGYVSFSGLQHRHAARMVAAYTRILSDRGFDAPARPLGLSEAQFGTFRDFPLGARDRGLLWPVQTSLIVQLADTRWELPAAAFEWWWEVQRVLPVAWIHWHRRRSLVATIVQVPDEYRSPHVRIARVDWTVLRQVPFGRDFKVESDSFNRRFHVRVDDEAQAVRLLGPSLQAKLNDSDDVEVLTLHGPWIVVLFKAPRGGLPFRFGGMRMFDVGWPHGTPARAKTQTISRLGSSFDDARSVIEGIPPSYWRSLRMRD